MVQAGAEGGGSEDSTGTGRSSAGFFLLSHLSGAAEFHSVVLMGSWHSIFVWVSAFGVSGMNGSPERVAVVLEYDDTLAHCSCIVPPRGSAWHQAHRHFRADGGHHKAGLTNYKGLSPKGLVIGWAYSVIMMIKIPTGFTEGGARRFYVTGDCTKTATTTLGQRQQPFDSVNFWPLILAQLKISSRLERATQTESQGVINQTKPNQ